RRSSPALATLLARRGRAKVRPAVLIGAWVVLFAAAFVIAGRTGLGTLLTAAFVLKVTPSIGIAYRTHRPTGISAATGCSSSVSSCSGRSSVCTSPIHV